MISLSSKSLKKKNEDKSPRNRDSSVQSYSQPTASGSERVSEARASTKGFGDSGSVMRNVWFCGIAVLALISPACKQGVRRSGIPAEAQSALDTSLEDIDAGRYEKLYQEAADEWRSDATLDQSKATFQKLRERLGRVRTRSLQSAREEQTSTAPIAGHSVVVVYQTSFELGDGMETLTLLERGGRWYLARYYVTSIALK